ncbi:helix-turn-helix domain-containing protein [Parasynechococcus sp.]|uniref:helix-turn-helix domain-containing protein n=1 Tax=Parasynechococcus sp. TaxID=3101203 RepID=UPI00370441A5
MTPDWQALPSSTSCLDRLFNSAEECAALWRQLGCDYHVVQISSGPLTGRLRMDRQPGMVLVSMQANQSLLIEGSRHPNWIPFTIEHSTNFAEHRHFGEPVMPHTMGGFNTQLKESFLRTSPGGNHIGVVLIDRSRVEALARLRSGCRILDRMSIHNSAMLSSTSHDRLKRLMALPDWQGNDAQQPFQADFLEAQLIEDLDSESHSTLRPSVKTHRSDLVSDLVRLSFQKSTEPLSLLTLCQELFTTKTTLTVSCREMFGYGPSALLRRVRLQQVHHVLRHPELRQQLGCSGVQDVAGHFGFVSRNHFASAYREFCSEAPSDTLVAAVSRS